MATQNPYSDSLLMDAVRGSLSNAESIGRGFAVAPVGLIGDINALAREYITPRLPQRVQGLLQAAPAAPTTEQILSNIPRVSAARRETAGMEQLGAAMNPRGPVELAQGAGRLAGNAINEAMVYGRGPLAGITPQPMSVIEKNPAPFIVKHGTNQPFDEFKSGMGVTAKHIYTTPENYAQDAAKYGDTLITAQASPKSLIDFSSEGKLDKPTVNALKKAAKDAGITDKYYPFESFMDDLMNGQLYQKGGGSRDQDALLSELFSKYQAVKMPDATSGGGISKSVVFEDPSLLKIVPEQPSFTYPQEEAMRLAQQRAALPVEQGGLGLAADNTAAQREAAMFPLKTYRGTTGDIESSVIPSDFFGSNYFGKGINLTTSPKDASKYASTDVEINHDLVGKAELMSQKLGISYPEAKAQLTSGGGTVMPISANIDNPLVVGAQKIQAPDSMIRYAINESGYSGDVDKLVKQFKDANTGFEQFELMKSKQVTPFYQNLSSLMNKNGLMIDESLSPKSEGGMHYVASSPEQLRSRFAAFDPWRRTAATAALMGVAAPDLLAQEQPVITQQQIDDELMKYGLIGR